MAVTGTIAVAACSFAVDLPSAVEAPVWIQLTPAGEFRPADGREMVVDHWFIDAAAAEQVIARFNARTTPPVIDYEHQTLYKEENGQPAPAAAWPLQLQWREGQGLFAHVELTAKAREAIINKEYQYFSPVIAYHPKTGAVTSFEMGALTNTPAIHGMDKLELLAAASFGSAASNDADPENNPKPNTTTHQEHDMDKLIALLFSTLGLAKDTTETDAIAALSAHFAVDPLTPLRVALDQAPDATAEHLIAACSALKAESGQGAAPNPAEYVSVNVMRDLQNQVAALSAQVNTTSADTLITDALANGRLLPGQKAWAEDLAKSDIAALTAYIASAEPIAALNQQQTHGKKPDGSDDGEVLDKDELAVCSAMGISPENYLKTKKASAA
jgi:phage I-like protein